MKRMKKEKREKFSWLLTKSLAVALAFACVFAVGFQTYMYEAALSQLTSQIDEEVSARLVQIIERSTNTDPKLLMNDLSNHLTLYTNYNVCYDQFGLFDPQNSHSVQIVPNYSNGCHAMAALTDKDGNIVASSRQNLQIFLKFDQDIENDTDRGFYSCDPAAMERPEIRSLMLDYNDVDGLWGWDVELQADSLYINRKERTFIPHEGSVIKTEYKKQKWFSSEENGPLISDQQIKNTESSEYTIDINDLGIDSTDYELTDVYKFISGEETPRYAFLGFYGTDQAAFDSFEDEFRHPEADTSSYHYYGRNDGTATFARNIPVSLNGEKYTLSIRYVYNYMEPALVRYYWTYTILVAALLIIIALLYAWRRNVRNKARYAMEDFRRDLTNDLAHDIKTPLTAIGGYAENILDGDLTDAEKERYLRSILDNVAFTDSMISRTLQLNKMDGSEKLRRESVNVSELLEASVNKYEILLDEKNIRFSSDGSATVKADRAALEVIIENLVSNAVKYTSENGSVNAECSEKGIVITNSVAQKVDVKALTQPFVRGDQARSNTEGSGLGLALADRAAQTAGMSLKLSCADTEFRAELKF